nr:hypothetical protein [bacterium]
MTGDRGTFRWYVLLLAAAVIMTVGHSLPVSAQDIAGLDVLTDGVPAPVTGDVDLDLAGTVAMALRRSYGVQNDALDRRIAESGYRLTRAEYSPMMTLQSDSTVTHPGDSGDGEFMETTLDHRFQASLDKVFATTGGSLSIYSILDRFDDTGTGSDFTSDIPGPVVSGLGTERYANRLGIRLDQPLLRDLGPWSG